MLKTNDQLSVATARGTGMPLLRDPTIVGCLAATWLIWGSTYLAIRFALIGFAPFYLMATRFLLAGALLFGWLAARGARLPTVVEWRNAAVVGALMLGGGMGGTAYAEQTIGSGLVVAFIAIVPLLTVALNRLFGVVPARRELVAVVIGAAGVGLLTRGAGFRASPAGLAAISIATTSWALGSLLSRHRLPLAPGAIGYASEMLAGGVLLLVASAWRGESWSLPTAPVPWGAWAYLVVFGSLLAFSAYMTLLARTSVAVAASYSFVNPIVALLLGVVIGGEQITPGEWVAASVIVGSVLVLLVRRP